MTTRRLFLLSGLRLAAIAGVAGLLGWPRHSGGDEIVLVDGWFLKRSDLGRDG